MHAHRTRCDQQTSQETRPCSPRPHSQLLSLSALPQARLLGLSSTAATPRTTCTSMANTSAQILIRPSAPCSRVTPPSSDDSRSQVAAGSRARRHLSAIIEFVERNLHQPARSRKWAMPKTGPRRLISWMLATFVISMMAHAATAGSFTRGCAARDLQLLTVIEEQENAGSIPSEKIS